ncbi:MAG: 6-bladed beta-propeller [Bacteroidia bacterium]|nr:MAG: 6-bladed beta-propeller [Bacteroidia bacterium]
MNPKRLMTFINLFKMRNRLHRGLFTGFILVTFLSCSSDLNNAVFVKRIKSDFSKDLMYDAVLLVPEAGCPGCISFAEKFTRENLNNKKILFLFTRIISEKTLRAKLTPGTGFPSNIFIDRENRYAVPVNLMENEFPVIVYFAEDGSTTIDPVTPDNQEAYDRLLDFIRSKLRNYNLEDVVLSKESITGLSSFARQIEYIPLKSDGGILLSSIQTIYFDAGKIFISDTQEKIIVFDQNGKPLTTIGKKGEGPEEYRSLIAGKFTIDKKRQEVIIPDFSGKKLIIYDYEGRYLRSFPTKHLADDIGILNDTLYCLQVQPFKDTLQRICNIAILDRQGREVALLPTGHLPRLNFISSAKLDATGTEIFYEEPFNDTIFRITHDFQKMPSAVIQMGRYKPPEDIFGDIGRWPQYASKYVFNRYLFNQGGDLWFSFFLNTTLYSGYFRFTDTKPVLYYKGPRDDGIVDDIDFGPPFNPFFHPGDNFMIDFIEPSVLTEEKYSAIRSGSVLSEIRTKCDSGGNPVIRILILN